MDDRDAEAQLRQRIRDDFGLELATLERTGLGADENAENWLGTGDSGRYAVKLSAGAPTAGLLVADQLARQASTRHKSPMSCGRNGTPTSWWWNGSRTSEPGSPERTTAMV